MSQSCCWLMLSVGEQAADIWVQAPRILCCSNAVETVVVNVNGAFESLGEDSLNDLTENITEGLSDVSVDLSLNISLWVDVNNSFNCVR